MKEEFGSQEAQCKSFDADVYGRTAATYFVAGEDIAENMVASGYAARLVRYSDRYVEKG